MINFYLKPKRIKYHTHKRYYSAFAQSLLCSIAFVYVFFIFVVFSQAGNYQGFVILKKKLTNV